MVTLLQSNSDLPSGDGSLTVVDLRQRTLQQKSDPSESELLSLAIVKACLSLYPLHIYVHQLCVLYFKNYDFQN